LTDCLLHFTASRSGMIYGCWTPRTDLLIRLMPERLFVHLGEKGALPAAAGVVLVTMGFVRMKFTCPERSEGRTDY